jgi:hypothetical protein
MTPQVSELVRLGEIISAGLDEAAAEDPAFYTPGDYEEIVIQFKAAIAAVKAAG